MGVPPESRTQMPPKNRIGWDRQRRGSTHRGTKKQGPDKDGVLVKPCLSYRANLVETCRWLRGRIRQGRARIGRQGWSTRYEISLNTLDRGFKSAHLLFDFGPSAFNKSRIKFPP